MGASGAVYAVAIATVRDRVRRPAFGVGVLVLGALLGVLPRLGNPAAGMRDNAALAVELTASTALLAGCLVAALLAIACLKGEPGGGIATEVAVAPTGIQALTIGTWLGATAVSLALTLCASGMGAIGWIGVQQPWPAQDASAWLALAVAWGAGTALGGAIGAVHAAWAPRDLATAVAVIHVVAVRAVLSWTTSTPGASWRWVVPDPLRFECAREFAHGRSLGWDAALVGGASTLTHASALLLVAIACTTRAQRAGAM